MSPEKAFIDTNIFLRYFLKDDAVQSEAAVRLLERAAAGKVTLVTNAPTVVEFVWVLESVFQLSHQDVSEYVFALLSLTGLEIESADILALATDYYENKNIDFVDAYNLAWMKVKGHSAVYTFDQRHYSRVEGIDVKTP